MRTTIQKVIPNRFKNDDGVALPFIAAMLVLLLGMAAFAVDLGWIYLNGARLQRAADSSALAGVVYLPADVAGASANAVNGANANGWNVGSVNGSSIGGGPDELSYRQLADNRLEVTLRAAIPTFFLKVVGFDDFSLSRTATAEYVKPVPIGSPNEEFGASNNLWASINGRWTAWMQGDPFNTRCDWSRGYNQGDCIDSSNAARNAHWPNPHPAPAVGDIDSNTNPLNPQFDGRGYAYGVEVQENRTSLQVELYDPRFRRPNNNGCGNTNTGDCDRLTFGPPTPNNGTAYGPTTTYTLYYPDGTPLDPYDNSTVVPGCTRTFSPTTNSGSSGVNEWVNLCSSSVANPDAGIHVLRVTANDGTGSNQYGVRAVTQGPGPNTPRVYGINYVSIYTNQDSSTSTLYLAEIDPIHAGKVLELRFFDAGEDDASASFTIQRPGGATATCQWESEDGQSGGPGGCAITTTVFQSGDWRPRFNAQWLTVQVEIPSDYNCDITDPLACWWQVSINNSEPHDRTTWAARIIGNPVRLVPNE